MEILFIVIFALCSLFTFSSENQVLLQARNARLPVDFDDQQVRYLAELSNISHVEAALEKLLIPRVVNTPNHDKVFNFLVTELEQLGWNVEIDEFESKVPKFGTLTFKNVVGTLNPTAHQFLVLACHYDSKYFAEFDFIGATDSAVPCAMLLNLAQVMKNDLDTIENRSDVGLKLVFFDGEEAFVQWGPNDSIYGAKHLASKWDQNLRVGPGTELTADINRINVLVLLDLIGERNPTFYCLFQDTVKWYIRLADAEERLAQLGLLKNHKKNYFQRRLSQSFIEDDHIPFLQRGVPILHLIPTPFPSVWHTEGDNSDIIDITTVENINKILRIFVAEYLHLSVT